MSKRLLLIDDEPDIREVAQLSLELAGWEVFTAASGAEGLVAAATHQPDAVLLDVMMPGMDGPATFAKLQADARTRDIPVLMFTAKTRSTERQALEQLGVKAVLSKPFDPMRLPTQVAKVLGWTL